MPEKKLPSMIIKNPKSNKRSELDLKEATNKRMYFLKNLIKGWNASILGTRLSFEEDMIGVKKKYKTESDNLKTFSQTGTFDSEDSINSLANSLSGLCLQKNFLSGGSITSENDTPAPPSSPHNRDAMLEEIQSNEPLVTRQIKKPVSQERNLNGFFNKNLVEEKANSGKENNTSGVQMEIANIYS